MKKTYRLGELFCGPGGLACGALSATSSDGTLSVAHAWANDFDHDSCMTYRNNLCPSSPGSVVEGDVRDLDIPGLRSRFGNIDAFAYGFPCNSFSSLGKHNGIANKKFGQLYWYGVEVLREYQPDWFLAENVSGIRSAGTGDFRKILQDLRESGYSPASFADPARRKPLAGYGKNGRCVSGRTEDSYPHQNLTVLPQTGSIQTCLYCDCLRRRRFLYVSLVRPGTIQPGTCPPADLP